MSEPSLLRVVISNTSLAERSREDKQKEEIEECEYRSQYGMETSQKLGNWELGIGNWELGIGNWELGK